MPAATPAAALAATSPIAPPSLAPAPVQAAPAPPHRLRLALVMVFAVYPLITTILLALGPLTEGWPVWERTLIVTPIMVLSILYGVLPAVLRLFGPFLRPR